MHTAAPLSPLSSLPSTVPSFRYSEDFCTFVFKLTTAVDTIEFGTTSYSALDIVAAPAEGMGQGKWVGPALD